MANNEETKFIHASDEEIKIICEIGEYIKKKYSIQTTIKSFEVFEPLTPMWKSKFKYDLGGYGWGKNFSKSKLIELTRCCDRKAFYELVFHEIYEVLKPEGHGVIVPEQRKYNAEKFGIKLDK